MLRVIVFLICVCDTQTQMRYGNAPIMTAGLGGEGTDRGSRASAASEK
jgi:hypothetical protein